MMSPASVYRIFRRPGDPGPGGATSVRIVVVALVVLALALTGIGVVRVTRQHDVLRQGLRLSKASEHVRKLREVRRQLELEYAIQSSPERIRRLATQLGMTTVAPDKIRVVTPQAPAVPRTARTGKVATR